MTSPKYALSQYLQRCASTLAAQQEAEAAKAQEIRNKAKVIMDDLPGKDRVSMKLRVTSGLLDFGVLSSAFAHRYLGIYEALGHNRATSSLKVVGEVLIDEGLPIHLFQGKSKTGREEWCLAMDDIDQAECAQKLAQFRELS